MRGTLERMAGRRLLVFHLAVAFALALVAASVAVGAGGNFTGDAQAVALTAAQAKYKALTGSGKAPAPPPDKRRGYRSGWETSYLKGTVAKPISAFSLIYVYATAADAKRAYANSCEACTGNVESQGVSMKFQLTSREGTPAVIDIATCRNIYVATAVSGKITPNELARTAGALVGGVFAKAAAGGMSPCAKPQETP
jgi:hypothetical protein